MLVEPINDVDCLTQLTTIVRELARTTWVRLVAKHLGSREAVIEWLQSKPQDDDDGGERVQYISCDVPQRLRLFSDAPNCVERSADAAALLEALEQMQVIAPAERAFATVDRPLRHTGLLEKSGGRWYAIDLFPRHDARRNASWLDWVSKGAGALNQYAAKPVLDAYLGKSAGDAVDAGAVTGVGYGWDLATKRSPKKQPAPPVAPKSASPGAGQNSQATSQGGTNGDQKQAGKPGTAKDAEGPRVQPRSAVGGGAGQETQGTDDRGPHGHETHDEPQRGRYSGWWGLQ